MNLCHHRGMGATANTHFRSELGSGRGSPSAPRSGHPGLDHDSQTPQTGPLLRPHPRSIAAESSVLERTRATLPASTHGHIHITFWCSLDFSAAIPAPPFNACTTLPPPALPNAFEWWPNQEPRFSGMGPSPSNRARICAALRRRAAAPTLTSSTVDPHAWRVLALNLPSQTSPTVHPRTSSMVDLRCRCRTLTCQP